MEFTSLAEVEAFLTDCDGKAPKNWNSANEPQTAAWCAVDLALLDCFGRAFREPIRLGSFSKFPENVKYSPVLSAESGFDFLKTLVKIRIYGFRQVKLKLASKNDLRLARLARRVLGSRIDIRADANMAWSVEGAQRAMRDLSRCGIRVFEQPIASDNVPGLARLVKQSGLGVMVDEGLNDRRSLQKLTNERACTAVNVRISKCGGLMASLARCREALDAGLAVQIGCQVGESSLLSAAHLVLVTAVQRVAYAEGCFGYHLLREDPAEPVLQFGYGGRPPAQPKGFGLGVTINEMVLKRWTVQEAIVQEPKTEQE
jgi:L-Ala-D/L-Glu epimerase